MVQSQGVLGRYFNPGSIRHREFSPYQVHRSFSVSTNPVKPVKPHYSVASCPNQSRPAKLSPFPIDSHIVAYSTAYFRLSAQIFLCIPGTTSSCNSPEPSKSHMDEPPNLSVTERIVVCLSHGIPDICSVASWEFPCQACCTPGQ